MNTNKAVKTRTITKRYDSLNQAERFQNRLYDRYNEVTLIDFPRFSEDGTYQWSVRGAIAINS